MVRLIQFELRKNFIKWSILAILLIFTVIDVIKINYVYKANSYLSDKGSTVWNRVYWQLYDEYSGPMKSDKIEDLLTIYRPLEQRTADLTSSPNMNDPNTLTGNVYSDYFLLRDYYVRPMEYAFMYQNSANKVVRTAQDNMDFYSRVGNTYLYRENKLIANLFSGRVIRDFTYTEMYQYYLEYGFSSLLVLLLCLYGLVGVFVSEKETDMEAILLTTRLGGRKTVIAKVAASMLFVFVICLWFWLLDFAAFSVSFGSFEAAASPLYALKNFEYTALDLTMGQFALFSGAVKTCGMMVIGMAYLFISSAAKSTLIPFAGNLALTAVLIIWQEITADSSHALLNSFNPFLLIANQGIFRQTEFVNFFGTPVLSCIVSLLFAIFSAMFLFFLLMAASRKNALVGVGESL